MAFNNTPIKGCRDAAASDREFAEVRHSNFREARIRHADLEQLATKQEANSGSPTESQR
jgi:hypothetical protein